MSSVKETFSDTYSDWVVEARRQMKDAGCTQEQQKAFRDYAKVLQRCHDEVVRIWSIVVVDTNENTVITVGGDAVALAMFESLSEVHQ